MSVVTLASDIARIMRKRSSTSNNNFQMGLLEGSEVLVNGKYYQYECAVDVDIDDGETVFVMISNDGSKAVIVGK
jgi:hypothetical protein